MSEYPLMLSLEKKPVLVIGGGKVAARKIAGLTEAGAKVTVVAPTLSPPLDQWHREQRLVWRKKPFAPEDVQGFWVVVAATDSAEVNQQVADSVQPHQLVNIADQPQSGNFTIPAHFRRGRLTVAVSTGGASPSLAVRIRDRLAAMFSRDWADALDTLMEKRNRLLREPTDKKETRAKLRRMADEALESLWDTRVD
ncbi:precorrin-2 dehydrogenase [Marinithermofilum abyssi]|uniref:precorrin-2 dehydrogenase n=1 Tax=Marinithermofilum abyssi TaxID=1571185 RepID=A0A8J2VGL4_9BACL|nr:NAD(P)-dependent oxidoreductase [Marinithermofilum abyssi]GGE17379.1 precorrin-2 dehydrogenase [Marinithermofilum abyssi]